MTSFIDLMANDRWSDADITARTEAILRSQYPAVEEQILNRDFTGALSGLAPMTQELQARALAFKAAAEAARQAGAEARADMALLEVVLAVERGELLAQEASAEAQIVLEQRAALRVEAEPTLEPTAEPQP